MKKSNNSKSDINFTKESEKYLKMCNKYQKILDTYEKIYIDSQSNIKFKFDLNKNLDIINNLDTVKNFKKISSELSSIQNKISKPNIIDKSKNNNLKINQIVKKSSSKINKRCKLIYLDIKLFENILDDTYTPNSNTNTSNTKTSNLNEPYINKPYTNTSNLNEPYTNTSNSKQQTIEHLKALKKGIKKVGGGISGFINKIKEILGIFPKIIKKITGLGKTVGKVVSNIVKKIFGAMLSVFKFIKNKLVPIIVGSVKFIIKWVPKIFMGIINYYKWLFRTIIKIMRNYAKSPIIPWLIFIVGYFGIQIYTTKIIELNDSLPPVIPLAVGGIGALFCLFSFGPLLIKFHKILIKYIIMFFKSKFIKKLMKLPPDFGKNPIKSIKFLLSYIGNNFFTIIVYIFLLLFTVKYGINYIINLFSNSDD
jgi:hypothetical protein